LGHDTTGSWWESLAAYRAHDEMERILVRLTRLRENIWKAVG